MFKSREPTLRRLKFATRQQTDWGMRHDYDPELGDVCLCEVMRPGQIEHEVSFDRMVVFLGGRGEVTINGANYGPHDLDWISAPAGFAIEVTPAQNQTMKLLLIVRNPRLGG